MFPLLASSFRPAVLPRASRVGWQDETAIRLAKGCEVALEFCSRIENDHFRHSKDSHPCLNKRMENVLRSLSSVSKQRVNLLISASPAYHVEPELSIVVDIGNLDQVNSNDVVEAVGPRDCGRSSGFRALIRFAFFAPKMFPYPIGNIRICVSSS